MSFAHYLEDFIWKIRWPSDFPQGVELLYPFDRSEVIRVVETFYNKYYNDDRSRVILLGINPGRFGAGITGVTFTDPIQLEKSCDIQNSFDKKSELSSTFVYEMIRAFGGPERFYGSFLLSAVFPLGFIRDGKNLNYYDLPKLQNTVEPAVIEAIKLQIKLGVRTDIAFSMGQGKNFKYLNDLNKRHRFFDEIKPLPHPRWVMQYRLKRKEEFIKVYIDALEAAIQS
jgi:hypothetical protein